MSYDNLTQVLTIKVLHQVKDPADHFIRRIGIKTNDNVAVSIDYTRQTDKEGLDEAFTFSKICEGSKISVKATCNKFGMIERSFEINGFLQERPRAIC
jgi:desulfoferrodoxin (superoxide reductase-like protein)